jgi:hypothetical protein
MVTSFTAAGERRAHNRGLKKDWMADQDCLRAGMFGVIESLLMRMQTDALDLDAMMAEIESLKGRLATRLAHLIQERIREGNAERDLEKVASTK